MMVPFDKCRRCGGPVANQLVFDGAHRHHLDCVTFLLKRATELESELKQAQDYYAELGKGSNV